MLCKNPYRKGPQYYGCGQCQNCRINRSREWIGRMLLESREHPASSFWTLTYDSRYEGPLVLQKRHVQLFIKTVRNKLGKCRFYAVGEYGDKSWRPHYHVILFGIGMEMYYKVASYWPFGFVHVGEVNPKTIQYICGYVVKKMTNSKDKRLQGRGPEFCLMSRKGGLGSRAVDRMATAYSSTRGKTALAEEGSVGNRFRVGGKCYPFGSYLKRRLSSTVGLDKEQISEYNQAVFEKLWEEVRKIPLDVQAKQRAAKMMREYQRGKRGLL